MATSREIREGIQYIGEDEEIVYSLTTTNWGSTPTSPSVAIYSLSGDNYTDESTGVLTGSASVVGDVITLPKIAGLTAGVEYRVEVQFTISGNVFEAYARLLCER